MCYIHGYLVQSYFHCISFALHHNTFNRHGLGLQSDDAHLRIVEYTVYGLIANVCDTG